MSPGPVFSTELMTLARRKRYYVLRFVYGMVLLWIVWENYPGGPNGGGQNGGGVITIQEAASLGRWLFWSIVVAQSIAILALTPALVAGVIADQRQRKTLHYLLSSCLTSGEIVLGKLGSRLLSAGVYMTLSLPILALLGFLGGVDPNDVFLIYLASASTMYVIGAYSLVVSVHAKRSRDAVSSVYITVFAWIVGPPLLKALLPWAAAGVRPVYEVLRAGSDLVGATSPLHILLESVRGWGGSASWRESILLLVGLHLLMGSALAALAVVRLRPVHRAEGEVGRRFIRLPFRGGRLIPRPRCGDDPLIWKELFVSRTGVLVKVLSALIGIAVVGVIGYWLVELGGPVVGEILTGGFRATATSAAHTDLNVFIRVVNTCLLVVLQLGAASVASAGLTGEREGDTWVSLIATPLTPFQIVRAKLVGALWATRWIAALWLALAVIGLGLGALHPVGFVAATLVTTVYVVWAAALGLFCSLRARSSTRALLATVATMIFCNGLYLLAFVPFELNTVLPLVGVTPFVGASSLVTYRDVGFLFEDAALNRHGWRGVETLVTGVVSVVLYGACACLLIYSLVGDFDDVIDRPRTIGGRPRRLRPFSLPSGDEELAVTSAAGPTAADEL